MFWDIQWISIGRLCFLGIRQKFGSKFVQVFDRLLDHLAPRLDANNWNRGKEVVTG